MVVPRSSDEEGRCTIRYALYRLIIQGIRRCLGGCAPLLNLSGYPRSFEYFSGRPMWSIQGGFVWNHPLGINREYDRKNVRGNGHSMATFKLGIQGSYSNSCYRLTVTS
jgi:hypothetical protein